VGRFLEHTRVYYFENEGDPEVFCGSADWMERNFFRRVEVGFPLTNKRLRERVIEELHFYLRDNIQAWELQRDGSYLRSTPGPGVAPVSAQLALLARWAEGA
jgi:polyphosphate kinase